jgi:AAA domain
MDEAVKLDIFDFTREAYIPKVPESALVEGWLHRSTTLLFGQTITGKSSLAQWLALPVASGRDQDGLHANSAGPVAFVLGDDDGMLETYERLDLVRDRIGDGRIRLITPPVTTNPKVWEAVRREVEGCRLVVIDNLTNFVPGSLNNDEGVSLFYDEVKPISRAGTSVLVLAHASDKRDMNGNSTNLPAGSFVIRSYPRLFLHAYQSHGRLMVARAGNRVKRTTVELTLPTDRPVFTILGEKEAEARAVHSGEWLDDNKRIWDALDSGLSIRAAAQKLEVSKSRVETARKARASMERKAA